MNLFDLSRVGRHSVLNENSTIHEIYSTIRERTDYLCQSLITCVNFFETDGHSSVVHSVESRHPINAEVSLITTAARGCAYMSLEFTKDTPNFYALRRLYGTDRNTFFSMRFAQESSLVIHREPGYKTAFEVCTEKLARKERVSYCSLDSTDLSMNTLDSPVHRTYIDRGDSFETMTRVRMPPNIEEILTSTDHEFNARLEYTLETLQINAAFHGMGQYNDYSTSMSTLVLDDELYGFFKQGVDKMVHANRKDVK